MVSLSASVHTLQMKGNPTMSITEKDRLIVAQVAVKAATDLAANGHIQTNDIGDVAADLYAEVFNIGQLVFGNGQAPELKVGSAKAAELADQSAPQTVEQAAAVIEQNFPGAQRTEPQGPPASPKDALWRSALIDNPDSWWDNRGDKRNPKAPDFKAKNNGPQVDGQPAALWIDSRDKPDWVDAHLAAHG